MAKLLNMTGICIWVITNFTFLLFSIQILKNKYVPWFQINLPKYKLFIVFSLEVFLYILLKLSFLINVKSNDFSFYYNSYLVYPKGILPLVTVFEKLIKLDDTKLYCDILVIFSACTFDYIFYFILS